ncbi:MAG: hypothetical protein JJ992_17750, partial [Planctomycetes bacterium]|nr:hypothetical protein [Planctomycetota bacterium]
MRLPDPIFPRLPTADRTAAGEHGSSAIGCLIDDLRVGGPGDDYMAYNDGVFSDLYYRRVDD